VKTAPNMPDECNHCILW